MKRDISTSYCRVSFDILACIDKRALKCCVGYITIPLDEEVLQITHKGPRWNSRMEGNGEK
jgi:hypothetical protein